MELLVYSKANCPRCDQLKRQLDSNDIPYTEVRADLDTNARSFLIGQGHGSVPQMYRGGVHIKDVRDLL